MTRAASDSEMLQQYIVGRMSDTERLAFEERLASDTTLVRDLEESLRLREGLEILRERNQLVVLKRPRRSAFFIGLVAASAAAIAVVAVSVGLHYVRQSPVVLAASVTALRVRTDNSLAVVESYSFATLREATQTPVLELPSRGALELRALTSTTASDRTFRATLEEVEREETPRVGVIEHLVPDADGFVAIYADASRLKPGDYLLIVQSDGGDGSAERFAFRLMPVPAAAADGH